MSFVPDQPPDAVHEVAFVDVHDKAIEPPIGIAIGPSELLPLMSTAGAGKQASVSNGLLTKEPHPFQSVQVLVCFLFEQLDQSEQSQLGLQFALTL